MSPLLLREPSDLTSASVHGSCPSILATDAPQAISHSKGVEFTKKGGGINRCAGGM